MFRTAALLISVAVLASAQTLNGVIDVHAHSDPDGMARSIDAVDLAKLAKARGMRGMVLKNHYESTATLAYLVHKAVPEIEVAGGIALNLPVGGINVSAVEWMAKVKGGFGRVVWMPTFDSEHQVTSEKQNRPFVSVAKGGQLLPAVEQVLAVMAKNNMVLATGHSSPTEVLMLIRAAKKAGVKQVIVTHAIDSKVGMSVEQMKEAAGLGAFLEFVWVRPGSAAMKQSADAIKAIGPASVILASDLGQAANPLHPDGLLAFYKGLMEQGISEADIGRMSRVNPATLLGWRQ